MTRGGALYFAYGSNLDRAQMRRRCPTARLIGAGSVAGFRFEFAGYSRGRGGAVANIRTASRKAKVHGLVWHLSMGDIARLDRFEGVPFQYERETLGVRMRVSGDVLATETYILAEPVKRGALPTQPYVSLIGRAYREFEFNPAPLFGAIRELT